MAQMIAKFLTFDRQENIGGNQFYIWKMENHEGWFWCSFTKENLERKIILWQRKFHRISNQNDRIMFSNTNNLNFYPKIFTWFLEGKSQKEVIPEKN